jgi:hypothetical protein
VYAFFTKQGEEEVGCFYVGMSTSNVRGRITRHLGNDATDVVNYRDAFSEIKSYDEVFVCYSLKSGEKSNYRKLKAKLELLELVITALLRPEFLGKAAS